MKTCLMPSYRTRKTLPFRPETLFDIVCDIERYPEFLPWCLDARIIEREDDYCLADLTIGNHGLLKKAFRSRVDMDRRENTIHSRGIQQKGNPLVSLDSLWRFKRVEGGGAEAEFSLQFELKPGLLAGLFESVFTLASATMVDAFIARAKALSEAPATDKTGLRPAYSNSRQW